MDDEREERSPEGRVIGTEDATPLEFWVAVSDGSFLQLDDVVAPRAHAARTAARAHLRRRRPGAGPSRRGPLRLRRLPHRRRRPAGRGQRGGDGPGHPVRARGLRAAAARAARCAGPPATSATRALFFDGMEQRLPVGLSRDDEPMYVNLEFLDGTRGAHVNISGISGVATRPPTPRSCSTRCSRRGCSAPRPSTPRRSSSTSRARTSSSSTTPTPASPTEQADRYRALGLSAGRVPERRRVRAAAPGDPNAAPDVASRTAGVTSFFWTLEEFCAEELLPFLFADAEDDRAQYTMVVHNVTARLRRRRQARRRRRRDRRRRDRAHLPRAGRPHPRQDRRRRRPRT